MPLSLNLKKDEKLEIHWDDGKRSVYPISLLRTMCPCAMCREVRKDREPVQKKTSLTILPGNFSAPLTALSAELVGNYALKIEWWTSTAAGFIHFNICGKSHLTEFLSRLLPVGHFIAESEVRR